VGSGQTSFFWIYNLYVLILSLYLVFIIVYDIFIIIWQFDFILFGSKMDHELAITVVSGRLLASHHPFRHITITWNAPLPSPNTSVHFTPYGLSSGGRRSNRTASGHPCP